MSSNGDGPPKSTEGLVERAGGKSGVAAWALVAAGGVALLIFLLLLFCDGVAHLEITGQVGDFVGGVVGAFWALAGVLLFYSALKIQQKEFKNQQLELQQQREEFTVARVTNVIYRQLEVIRKKAERLVLKDGNTKKLEGEELISGLFDYYHYEYRILVDNPKDHQFHNRLSKLRGLAELAGCRQLREYSKAIDDTIRLTRTLIEREVPQGQKRNSDFVLDREIQSDLLLILATNLGIGAHCAFYSVLSDIWIEWANFVEKNDGEKPIQTEKAMFDRLDEVVADLSLRSRREITT